MIHLRKQFKLNKKFCTFIPNFNYQLQYDIGIIKTNVSLIKDNIFSLPIEKQEMLDIKNKKEIKLFKLIIKNNLQYEKYDDSDFQEQTSVITPLSSYSHKQLQNIHTFLINLNELIDEQSDVIKFNSFIIDKDQEIDHLNELIEKIHYSYKNLDIRNKNTFKSLLETQNIKSLIKIIELQISESKDDIDTKNNNKSNKKNIDNIQFQTNYNEQNKFNQKYKPIVKSKQINIFKESLDQFSKEKCLFVKLNDVNIENEKEFDQLILSTKKYLDNHESFKYRLHYKLIKYSETNFENDIKNDSNLTKYDKLLKSKKQHQFTFLLIQFDDQKDLEQFYLRKKLFGMQLKYIFNKKKKQIYYDLKFIQKKDLVLKQNVDFQRKFNYDLFKLFQNNKVEIKNNKQKLQNSKIKFENPQDIIKFLEQISFQDIKKLSIILDKDENS